MTELLLTIKNELYGRETYENSKVKKEPELPFKENHFSDKFSKVTDIATRRNYLRDSGRCFMCLRSGNKISECTNTKTCYYCKERHNYALCVKREKGISTNLSIKENTSILLQTVVVRLTIIK